VLSMTTFGSLMNEKTLTTYLPILRDTARDIASAVKNREGQLDGLPPG